MTKKVDVFPEIVTQPEDLVDHNNSKDMNMRILNTLSGSSLLCIIMEELDDSFLVALPCKLMAYGETNRVVEPYMPVRFVRFFKPTIMAVIPIFGEFEHFYTKWLLDNGNNLFPTFVGEEAVASLQKRYNEITAQTNELKESLESIAEKEEPAISSIPTPGSMTKH